MTQSGSNPGTSTGEGESGSIDEQGIEGKPGPGVSYTVYECPECSTTVLGIHDKQPDLSCHGHPMEPVEESGIDHSDPEIGHLLTEVYEMPKMTIDVCHFVFETGAVSVAETAEHFDYDRSTVSRYLRDLESAGFLERHTLNREQGGTVHVYEADDIEETRRKELLGFLNWAGQAAMVMDEANEIKAQCAQQEGSLDQIFWDVYQEKRTL